MDSMKNQEGDVPLSYKAVLYVNKFDCSFGFETQLCQTNVFLLTEIRTC